MMSEIEANIANLKDLLEKMRVSYMSVGEYHRLHDALIEEVVETIELFYKLVTQ